MFCIYLKKQSKHNISKIISNTAVFILPCPCLVKSIYIIYIFHFVCRYFGVCLSPVGFNVALDHSRLAVSQKPNQQFYKYFFLTLIEVNNYKTVRQACHYNCFCQAMYCPRKNLRQTGFFHFKTLLCHRYKDNIIAQFFLLN